jgi:hypothetical protein
MLTALISAIAGLFSATLPEILKEVKDTRAHKREVEFLQINQKLALERAQYEASVKIEDVRANATIAEIQANEHNFDALMRQAMTPIGIGWIDGLNAVVRPITAIAFMLLFAVGTFAYIFGMASNEAFASVMAGLFNEAMLGTLGFMFGSRAVRSAMPKAA